MVILLVILAVVAGFLIFYVSKAKKEHPKGLIAAALSNMGERFGYYIMNAILLLFIVSKFGLPDATAGLIYSVFYFGIYVLSLVGGIIADRTQNYHRTIQWGLIIMALGYVGMAIPLFSQDANGLIVDGNGKWWGILIFTCDNFEAEAAKKGPEALAVAKDKRDSGFQIFYVFINIGGVIAPFVAPMLREWWLKAHNFIYNADMSALCHQYLADGQVTQKFTETMANSVLPTADYGTNLTQFCSDYILTFNQGVHFSFFVSVAAMLISLIIFFTQKSKFPQPAKKVAAETVGYTAEEKAAMAKEIKQRMAALFAVLGIAVFFWLSFHQNGQSLSVFARDFVDSSSIAPEIWQALNPLFVIILTPLVMGIFAMVLAYTIGLSMGVLMARRKDKLADKLGMVYIIFIIAVPSLAYIYLFRYIGTNLFNLPSVFTTYGPEDIRSWILPIISLALPSIASLMLWTRRYVVDQMNSDYVKFAKAKGLNQREIFNRHIFKNAIIPIAQGIPASLAGCITGAIITESIYSVGGMGKMLPNAINQYNNVMIVALAFIFSSVSVISVLLGDIVLTKVDPRISLSEKAGRS